LRLSASGAGNALIGSALFDGIVLLELPVVPSGDVGGVQFQGIKPRKQFDELKELMFIQCPPARGS
jgi:hypothetical protein